MVSRPPTRPFAAGAFALAVMAMLVSLRPAAALSCVKGWEGDTFAGAQQAVANPDRWDGLVAATITATERKDDYWRTRVLVMEPEVVFAGDLRETVRVEIGGHGPEMSFAAGSTYFLALARSGDPGTTGWFVEPCAPNMELTNSDQLAELRATSDSEVVISEPVITGTPAVVWVGVGIAAIALTGLWLILRRRPMISASGEST